MPDFNHQPNPTRRPGEIRLALGMIFVLTAATNLLSQPVSITAPLVQNFGNFGYAVAGFGADRFLVTALQIDAGTTSSVGQAYLCNVSGARLTTFTNPAPVNGAFMGNSIAQVGSDQIIVAASEVSRAGFTNLGEAYLFNTNGTLMKTFTNPTPQSYALFGEAVAGVGSDRLLIGADGADSGANFAVGKAYLLTTNGTLKATFNNPVLTDGSLFGFSLASVSSNCLLISAYAANEGATVAAGRAYLFTTNGGAPTRTFVNPSPTPDASFGYAVAALGTNRVIIGAFGVSRSGFTNSGEAYLFSTNGGAPLITFTNPAPSAGANFGGTVAAVGTNLVLIGADGATRAGFAGAGEAYLFATNGMLLATYTNPAPAGLDSFGWSVAGVGSNRIVIGAPQVDLGANGLNGGKSFLYAPTGVASTNVSLLLSNSGPDQILSWIAPDAFVLQETTNLSPPVVWTDCTNVVNISGTTNTSQTSPAQGPAMRFHRLRRL